MSKLPPSTLKFVWFAGIILVAASLLSVAGLPYANDWRHHQANQLADKAASESGSAAESNLKLARLFSPHDDSLRITLAQAQIANGHLNAAISTLKSSRSEAGESLRGGTQMGLDEYDSAITSFQTLVANHPSDAARVDLAEAQIEAGEYQSAKTALAKVSTGNNQAYVLSNFCDLLLGTAPSVINLATTFPVASPEAFQAVQRAQSSKLALAQELYAYGLPGASQSVLMKLDGSTTTEWLLRADIALGRPTPNLAAAITDLNTGLKLDPSDVELRTLLQRAYDQQGNTSAASAQHALLIQTEGQ